MPAALPVLRIRAIAPSIVLEFTQAFLRTAGPIENESLHALHELARSCKHDRTLLLLADVHAQPMFALARSDILEEIGETNLFGNLDDALDRAREFLGLPAEPHPPEATPTVARETPPGIVNRIA